MPKGGRRWVVWGIILGLTPVYAMAQVRIEQGDKAIKLHYKEDPEVGKKRLELLDKALSPALIERRREIVRQFEEDYNQKISRFLQEITTYNSQNTVITHVDMHFFDPGFKEQIEVERDVSVAVVLGRAGLDLWRKEQPEQQALDKLRHLISTSFRVPAEHITLTVGP